MVDIAICILPKVLPDAPTVGPSLLKSHIEDSGFSCKVLDFNVELYNFLKKKEEHVKYYFDDDSVFVAYNDELSEEFLTFYNNNLEIFEHFIEQLEKLNPKYVGMSLLSRWSQASAVVISKMIREKLPHVVIVWGGAQIATNHKEFIKIQEKGYFDYFINGDGEFAIIELLKGNLDYKGINSTSPIQVLNLDLIKIPNYDDIEWEKYKGIDPKTVYITGSRGCVKRCTFCNVYEIWPEYKFRSAEKITEEIVYLTNQYDRKTFKFTDSLINGSMKAYRQLLLNMKDHKQQYPDFVWKSQWIIRSKSQSPEEDYRLMSESGCEDLEIGLESFNEDIRFHMGKKFTDEDMWWCFDMLQKYNIPATLLMITGYPIESEEHHKHTLKLIKQLYKKGYVRNSEGRQMMYFSFTPMLLSGTLYDMYENDLDYYNTPTDWKYKDNTNEVRIRRYTEILDLLAELDKRPTAWSQAKYLTMYKKKGKT